MHFHEKLVCNSDILVCGRSGIDLHLDHTGPIISVNLDVRVNEGQEPLWPCMPFGPRDSSSALTTTHVARQKSTLPSSMSDLAVTRSEPSPSLARPATPPVVSFSEQSAPPSTLSSPRLAVQSTALPVSPTNPSTKPRLGGQQGVTNKVLVHLASGSLCSPEGKSDEKMSPTKPGAAIDGADGANTMRTHCVSSYFDDAEYARLAQAAKSKHRRMGAVLRESFLRGASRTVPEPNREKWVTLAHSLSNLNQLTYAVNTGIIPENLRPLLGALTEQIHQVRAELTDTSNGK